MPVIVGFPNDEVFRFIKWVDRFKLPHAGTGSASVEVLLQTLPIGSIKELNRLDGGDVRAVIGTRSDTSSQHPAAGYTRHQLLAGTLPHLRIGGVYKGRQYVGQLPATRRHIDLPHESQLIKATIGAELDPPLGWGEGMPYRPMTAKQYELRPFRPFEQAACLYFLDQASSTEYIIPRSVVFRTFYAPHTLLANAFTSGPWATTAHALISESDFQSGLKTQVDSVTGTWDVVLTPHVPTADLAHLLALLWHETYARRCADNVYTAMLQGTEQNGDHVWFASAEIPFRPNDTALPLVVRGFDLSPRKTYFAQDSEVPRHSFLVTSIESFPWPAYAPTVRWQKTNSGDKGKTQTTGPGPRPYSGTQHSEQAGGGAHLSATADASPEYPQLDAAEDKISIIGAPPLEKIEKQSSIHYEGGSPPAPEGGGTPEASSGNPSYGTSAQQPVRHNTIVRNKISNFAGLLDALGSLSTDEKSVPVRYSVIQPEDQPSVALEGGEPCWDFLCAAERQHNRLPHFGWKMTREHKQRVPRTALILRIALQDREGYWIEIEPRTFSDAMCSPFLIGVVGDVQTTLRSALGTISSQCGHRLQAPIEKILADQGGGRVRCFRHRYVETEQGATWSTTALRVFLEGALSPECGGTGASGGASDTQGVGASGEQDRVNTLSCARQRRVMV